MHEFPLTIYRNAQPTILDQAPYTTVCIVNDDIYIQISKDEEEPNWYQHIGTKDQAKLLIDTLLDK
jgi:hypothetical protein